MLFLKNQNVLIHINIVRCFMSEMLRDVSRMTDCFWPHVTRLVDQC